MKKILSVIMICAMLMTGCATKKAGTVANTDTTTGAAESGAANDDDMETEDVFAEWNDDAASLNALIDYVEAVTDESSKDFIPKEHRT
jgi:uncharacterized protein YceK